MEPPCGRTRPVDVGGRCLNTWLAGDEGPTVLLVHGIPTNHRLWWDVVPGLADHAQVVAVDMLGYGESDDPDGWDVDLASQASYLVALLDALGRDRAVVVGHDLGGGVAQILAVTQPDRVTGLGVIDGVCYDAWPVPGVRVMKSVWPLVRLLPPPALASVLRRALGTLFVHRDRAPQYVDRFVEPWLRESGPRVLTDHLRSLDSVYTQSVAPFLPRLRVPVEVVWGRQDHQLKPRYGQRLARDITGSGLTWVPDAGHFVPADRPDVVVAAVRTLLTRVAA